MADQDVRIRIDTTANTRGAKEAARSVEDITRDVDAMTRKVNASEFAFYNLDEALKRDATRLDQVSEQARRFGTAAGTAGAANKRFGTVAQQAGYQVQDFATQVAGGTSAMTALGQQGPQLLSIFGPGGAIAGALLSIGALIGNVMLNARREAGDTEDSLEGLKGKIDEVAEAAAKLQEEELEFGDAAIKDAIESAKGLIGAFDAAAAAEGAYSKQALDNAEALRKARAAIAELLGPGLREQPNQVAEILNAEAAAADAREQAARNAAEQELRRLDNARRTLQADREGLATITENLIQEGARLQAMRDQLAVLRQQKAELEEIARTPVPITEQGYPGTGPSAAQRRRSEAQAQLADPSTQAELLALEEKIAGLEERLDPVNGRAMVGFRRAVVSLGQQEQQILALEDEVATKIAGIEQTLGTQDIVGQVDALGKAQEASANEIEAAIKDFVPQNEAQRQSIEILRGLIEDGKLTADEVVSATRSLGSLQGALGPAVNRINTNLDLILKLTKELDRRQQQFESEIRGQIRALEGRR